MKQSIIVNIMTLQCTVSGKKIYILTLSIVRLSTLLLNSIGLYRATAIVLTRRYFYQAGQLAI